MGKNIRENNEKMEVLFTRIASQTAGELPENWTNLGIGFAIDTRGFETFLVYYSDDQGKTYRDFMEESFEYDEPAVGLFDAKESCQELHKLCKSHGDNWTQFALVLNNQGNFAADFSYEPIELFSRLHLQLWRGRYLK